MVISFLIFAGVFTQLLTPFPALPSLLIWTFYFAFPFIDAGFTLCMLATRHIPFLHYLKTAYQLFPPLSRIFAPKTLFSPSFTLSKWDENPRKLFLLPLLPQLLGFATARSLSTFSSHSFLVVYTFCFRRPFKTHIFHIHRLFTSIHPDPIIHVA